MKGYSFAGMSDREVTRWVQGHPIAGGQGPFTTTTSQTQTFPGAGDPATMDATRRAYLKWLQQMGLSQDRIAELTGTGPQGIGPALSDIYTKGGTNLATLGGRAGTVGAAPLNLPAFARPITQNLTENILPGIESRALFVGAPFGGRSGDLTARALREYGTAIGDVESRAELARRQQELAGIAEAGTLGGQATKLKAEGALTPLTLALQGVPAPVPIPQPSGPQTSTTTGTSEPSDFSKFLGGVSALGGLNDLYRTFRPEPSYAGTGVPVASQATTWNAAYQAARAAGNPAWASAQIADDAVAAGSSGGTVGSVLSTAGGIALPFATLEGLASSTGAPSPIGTGVQAVGDIGGALGQNVSSIFGGGGSPAPDYANMSTEQLIQQFNESRRQSNNAIHEFGGIQKILRRKMLDELLKRGAVAPDTNPL